MYLILLGRLRKGRKSFSLESTDELGFTIECTDDGGWVRFNNITAIEWVRYGERVFLTPQHLREYLNFTRYKTVTITKAESLATKGFESIYY